MGRLGSTGRNQTGAGRTRGGTELMERLGNTGVTGTEQTGLDEATAELDSTELGLT